jgi:hypothetical protein
VSDKQAIAIAIPVYHTTLHSEPTVYFTIALHSMTRRRMDGRKEGSGCKQVVTDPN